MVHGDGVSENQALCALHLQALRFNFHWTL